MAFEMLGRPAADLGQSELLKKLQTGHLPLDSVLRLDGGRGG